MSEPDGAAVERAREEVIEAMERSADLYGIKRSYARLYGILYFASEPLSLDELVAESDYAKSTVSTAMSALDRYHLAYRRSVPGEGKKAYYEAERDLWYVTKQLLDGQARREIAIMTRALDDAIDRLEDADGGEEELERIRELRKTYGRFERMVDLVTSQPLDRVQSVIERLTGDDSSDRT